MIIGNNKAAKQKVFVSLSLRAIYCLIGCLVSSQLMFIYHPPINYPKKGMATMAELRQMVQQKADSPLYV